MNAFDIDFYRGSKKTLIAEITDASQQPYSYIVTPNVNHIVQLEHDQELKRAYASASHRVCDSRVLYPLLKALKVRIAEPIPGSSLTEELVRQADARAWSVSVIGCEAEDIDLLRQRYPGIRWLHHNPPQGFIDDEQAVQACVAFIVAHPAQLNLLSVGCPRQEKLALRVFESAQAVGVGLCVGGSLNFLSGRVQRAPAWVQRLSLEWLHRVCMEPRRLSGRYLRDALRVLPIIFRQFRHKPSLHMGGTQQ